METITTTTTQSQNQMASVHFRVNESETVEIQHNQDEEILEAQRTSMKTAIVNLPQYDTQISRQHPLRILLVEDSMVNMKIALWFLKKLGYHADVAFNGIEAVDALKRRNYDVILMDAEMPEMDGRVATVIIRNDFPSHQQPHIIAMTANTSEGDRDKYLSIGMNDYLTKPIKMEDLVRALLASQPLPAISTRAFMETDKDQSMLRVA